MTQFECTFCKIRDDKESTELFYKDDWTLAFLACGLWNLYHVIVASSPHVLNASQLSDEQYFHFMKNSRNTEKALLEISKKDRAVWLKSGGKVPHLHLHIYAVDKDQNWSKIKHMFDNHPDCQTTEEQKELLRLQLEQALSSPQKYDSRTNI